MITAKNIVDLLRNMRCDGDVVPSLRILGDEDVIGLKRKTFNLIARGRRIHELDPARDLVIVINVYVIAETNRQFSFDSVLVNAAESN
jgi:hypothetical protein